MKTLVFETHKEISFFRKRILLFSALVFFTLLTFSLRSLSAPATLTYQGRIVNANGTVLEYNNVSFLFEILNPSGSCVLYREQVNGINMLNSNGIFDVKIGASHTYPASGSYTVLDSFNNVAGVSVCDGGVAYNPVQNEGRILRVQFHDGTAWRRITPDSAIGSVPYAGYSAAASKLGSHSASDFILKTEVNGNATCGSGSFLTWNASTQTFGCDSGAAGTGTVTNVTSANSYLAVTNGTTVPLLTLNVGTGVNTVAAGNDARFTNARVPSGAAGGDLSGNYPNPSVAKIQGVGVDFAIAPSTGQVLKFDGTNWIADSLPAASSGTVTSITAGTGLTGGAITTAGTIGLGPALAGLNGVASNGYIQRTGAGTYSVTTGSVAASNNNLVMRDGSGVSSFYGVAISGATSGAVTFQAPSIVTNYSLTLPDAQGGANQVMANDSTGILTWKTIPTAPGADCGVGNVLTYASGAFTCVPDQVGSAGGGIASLGGQTGSSQSFGAIGTTGLAPAWNSATDVHTLSIPYARNASVTGGLISKAEYDAFNAKQTALGFTPLNRASNLSDLADAATARGNLGLGTAAVSNVPATGDAAASEVVLGSDTRLTNARAPSGAATGDLSGSYPNPTVSKIKNVAVSITSLTSGDFLKYNGTNWINSALAISDIAGLSTSLNSKIDQSQIVGTCSAAKTLTFSSVTGSWTCTDIAIADSQVTFASKTAKTFLAAPTGSAGAPTFRVIADTDLPASVTDAIWSAGSGNVYRSTGNVGVGTSSPNARFEVAASSASSPMRISRTDNTNHPASMAFVPNGALSSSNVIFSLGLIANSNALGLTSTDNIATTMRLHMQPNGNLGVGTNGNAASKLDVNGGVTVGSYAGTNAAPANGMLVSGNVGIGTTSPTTKLEVVGTVKATAFEGPVTATVSSSGTGSNSAPSISFSGDTDTGFYNTSSNDTISVATGGAKVFDFSSLGLVAATTGGGSVSTANGTASAPTFSFAGDTDTGWFRPAADTLAASTAGTERVRITSAGNVGIGTSSPDSPLNVQNSVGALGVTFRGATSAQLNLEADGLNRGVIQRASGASGVLMLRNSGSGNAHMAIDTLGNVGIATTDPTLGITFDSNIRNFTVTGSGAESTAAAGSIAVANNRPTPGANDVLGNLDFITANNGAGTRKLGARIQSVLTGSGGAGGFGADLTFATKPDNTPFAVTHERMRITSTGNVGIGTNSPGVALDVRSDSATAVNSGRFESSTNSPYFMLTKARGTMASPLAVAAADHLGAIQFRGYVNASTAAVGATIRATASGAPVAGEIPTYLSMQVTDDAGVQGEGFRLGKSTFTSARIVSTDSDLGTEEIGGRLAFFHSDASAFATGERAWIQSVSTNSTGQHTALAFGTQTSSVADGVERMRLDKDGNLGIGTTAPTAKLQTEINENGTGFLLTDSAAPAGKLSLQDGTSGIGQFHPSILGRPVGAARNLGIYSEILPAEDTGTVPIMMFSSRYETAAVAATRPLFQFRNHLTPVVTVSADGELGVGTATPAVLLHVNTATAGATVARFQSGTGSCNVVPNTGMTCSSDIRLKEDIKPIPYALEKVNQVQGVTFKWKDRAPADESRHVGFIAQEIEKIAPELVGEDDKGFKQVNYANFVAVLTQAMKEFFQIWSEDSAALHEKVEALKAENVRLRADVETQRKENLSIKQYLCSKDPAASICK